MKNYRIFIIVMPLILIASCKDIFEVSNSSFVKIYGENLGSSPNGFFQKEDGGFVIYGGLNKNIAGGGFIESNDMPAIIVTDEFGNQVLSREYPLGDFQYQQNDFSFVEWEINKAWFYSMIPLANGNYFATIKAKSSAIIRGNKFNHDAVHFVILDKNFNIKKYGFFNDYAYNIIRIHFEPVVYAIPNSNDILVLMRVSDKIDGVIQDKSIRHYAMYRFSIDGEILKIGEIEDRFLIKANDLTFDDEGNIVVTGHDFSEACVSSFVDVIDINDLQLINSNTLSLPAEWHVAVSIEKINEGYVVQDFSIDEEVINCTWWDPNNPTDANEAIGSIWFLDNNFNVTGPDTINEVVRGIANWSRHNLIRVRDGGFVVGYIDNIDNEGNKGAVIIKIDKDGAPLWSYREPRSWLLPGLVETSDGGIVFIARKEFNITGRKWYLIKLNKDGKLD